MSDDTAPSQAHPTLTLAEQIDSIVQALQRGEVQPTDRLLAHFPRMVADVDEWIRAVQLLTLDRKDRELNRNVLGSLSVLRGCVEDLEAHVRGAFLPEPAPSEAPIDLDELTQRAYDAEAQLHRVNQMAEELVENLLDEEKAREQGRGS